MSKVIVVTGASDGVGAAAARQLSERGEKVVVVGRSPERTRAVANELNTDYFLADFTELAQVRRLAAELIAAYPRIDVLANNAGGIMGERTITADGYEKTFQVNHLAPFLLTKLLMPTLIASRATVIQTASVAARVFGDFDIDDLQNSHRYAPQKAYGNGKLANILFTSELQHRYGDQGLAAVAFHPGIVATGFAAETTHFLRFIYHGPLKRLVTISPEAAAAELVRLAEATPGDSFVPGAYYESGRIATKVNPDAQNPHLAKQLWDRSEQLV